MKSLLRVFLGLIVLGLHTASAGADVNWLTNYKEALELAAKEKRVILLNFTGSDWCPPCMQLEKDVFEKPAFAAFADDNLVAVKLDFPRSTTVNPALKEQNEDLRQRYGVQGFPTLILLNSKGKEIAREVGYMPGGPAAFKKWVSSAK